MAGEVIVAGEPVHKAGQRFEPGVEITVKPRKAAFVSRGGWKLAGALDYFGVDPTGRVCLDAGASTGGFTDCLLQRGAIRVYAVDVGYGQLAWQLRQDERVQVMERTNIRHLQPADLPERVDLVTVDVSFISLTKVFPALVQVMKVDADLLALVKPQFEAGPERVGKRGVVRDPAVHRAVLRNVIAAAENTGLQVVACHFSSLRGPEGNIEFWVHARPMSGSAPVPDWEERVAQTVAAAHRILE
jgi:23S rRNA (cytidine1920-2'-O)/16S rRNA (cytidine1409-2'-O)-methyltransferase